MADNVTCVLLINSALLKNILKHTKVTLSIDGIKALYHSCLWKLNFRLQFLHVIGFDQVCRIICEPVILLLQFGQFISFLYKHNVW